MATMAEARGGGPARLHETASSPYVPSPERGFDFDLTGADVITEPGLIRRHFPYLAPETVAVAHARRAGWLSAQQLGMVMLEAIRERGVKLLRGRMVGIDTAGGARPLGRKSSGTASASRWKPPTSCWPPARCRRRWARCSASTCRSWPSATSRSASPTRRARCAPAPMLIWLDDQYLPWSEEERAALAEDEESRWLLEKFPWGVHGRPEGHGPGSDLHRAVQLQPRHRPTSSSRCPSSRTIPRSPCAAWPPWCRR